MPDMRDLLVAEMDRQGLHANATRAGLMAIAGGESGLQLHDETPYTHTDNEKIRGIFSTALGHQSDGFITDLKRNPEDFFNYVYGPHGAGMALGNTHPGDGYRYRGRGPGQITGLANYTTLAQMTGVDLVNHPELANDPTHAAAIVVAYMRWRYKGGGWASMKKAFGNSIGPPNAEKDKLFERYQASGEFNYTGGTPAAPKPAAKPALRAIQAILAEAGEYHGIIDGELGDLTRNALNDLGRREHAERGR